MILHDSPTAEIWQGQHALQRRSSTTSDGSLKTFDFVVANPPFSTKAWSNGLDPATMSTAASTFGVPPAKNGDYAFLLHILTSLKSTGKGAVILPHGVLFRGNAEADIRTRARQRGYIKGIIGLPPNLFYGTGIPACIVVLDKENAQARKGIFMIDASQGLHEGRQQEPPARPGHPQDRRRLQPADRDAALLAHGAASRRSTKNDYNLNLPRYIDSQRARGHAGHRGPPARRHPAARHRCARSRTGTCLPDAASSAVQARTAPATATWPWRNRRSSPPSMSIPSSPLS